MAERRYWDTACFISWFGGEEGRANVCGSILTAAEAANLEIVTSAFTLTEVLWPRGREKMDAQFRNNVLGFFRQP